MKCFHISIKKFILLMFLCMASHTMVYTQTTDSISFYMQQYEFENLISYIDLHYQNSKQKQNE